MFSYPTEVKIKRWGGSSGQMWQYTNVILSLREQKQANCLKPEEAKKQKKIMFQILPKGEKRFKKIKL